MRRLLALAVLLTLACSSVAVAASKHGITPKSPKKGATVATGSRPTFKGKFKGPGQIFVYVSKSKKTDKDGLIGDDAMIQKAHKKGSTFKVKAKFFDFPAFWLNSPGTYYWQAHRINCGEDGDDCQQEGPIVKFKVG
jgi:hypothetical protein